MANVVTRWVTLVLAVTALALVPGEDARAQGAKDAKQTQQAKKAKQQPKKQTGEAKKKAPAPPPPKQAAMVIDGNTGAVLFEEQADEARFPASLTKVMTLYMVFSEIEQGRLSYTSRITATARAAAAPPSKLDLKPGDTITVLDAVKALVVRSANDVAVAVAEHIGGSEPAFARAMTERARQLGMTGTTFRNASGLPDARQVTTARDMLTLALRIQDDFPKHYHLFSTTTFAFGGKSYRTHNTLMSTFPGMDGMKTGYIRASGFNLISSVRTGNKHIVGVVFGGQTANARNAHMQGLLFRSLERASTQRTRKASQPLIAQRRPAPRPAAAPAVETAWATETTAPPPAKAPRPQPPAKAAKAPAQKAPPPPAPAAQPAPDAIAQVLEQGDAPHPHNGPEAPAGIDPPRLDLFALREAMSETPSRANEPAPAPVAQASSAGAPQDIAALIRQSFAEEAPRAPTAQAAPSTARPPSTLDSQARALAMDVAAPAPQQLAARTPGAGYDVQIGAYASADEAQRRLEHVRSRAGSLLDGYSGATIPVQTADRQIFRARFVNFDERSATTACLELRRLAIDCLVMRAE